MKKCVVSWGGAFTSTQKINLEPTGVRRSVDRDGVRATSVAHTLVGKANLQSVQVNLK